MFCQNCGKELDANNICINPACPLNSETTSEFEKETSVNNNSTIDNFEINESTNENTNSKQSSGYNEISENDFNTGNNQNPGYNQNTNYNQNSGYNQNPNYNQNSGYNQNPNYNQNSGYNQNPNYNQNSGYNQNPNYNQNSGYNQNPNYNQNSGYNQNPNYNPNSGYNQSLNYGQNTDYNQENPFRDKNGISANEMMDLFGPKNTEFYMDMWNKSQEKSNFIYWNWPAFLFGYVWLCFRKMYLYSGILLAVGFAINIFCSKGVAAVLDLIIMIITGLFANQLYIKHSVDKIRAIKITTGLNPPILSQRLRLTGGITWIPVIVVSIILGLLMLIFIFLVVVAVVSGVTPTNIAGTPL
jgi:hypothetical protein